MSDILQVGTTLRGAGNFSGTVSGEGARYNVKGNITSDALAADGVRIKALNLTAQGNVDSKAYDLQGKVLADLLTAGDFQLNAFQLAGQVIGTGSDFRWVGDLRAALLIPAVETHRAAEPVSGNTLTDTLTDDATAHDHRSRIDLFGDAPGRRTAPSTTTGRGPPCGHLSTDLRDHGCHPPEQGTIAVPRCQTVTVGRRYRPAEHSHR